jgi:hypothetical protein
MILKREGEERAEVDLAAPGVTEIPLTDSSQDRSAAEMPLPVCPDGSPAGGVPEEAADEESPLGTSPLDAGLRRLDGAFPGESKEAPGSQGGMP